MKNKALKKVLVSFGVLLGAVAVFVAGFLVFASVTTLPVQDIEAMEINGNVTGKVDKNREIQLLTWNIGYGALDERQDFYYDGGTGVDGENTLTKAAEKAKEVTFSKVVLSGSAKDDEGKTQKFDNITIKFEKGTFVATNITHLDEVGAALLLNGVQAVGVPEEKDTTYYAGNGFKVEYKAEDGKKTATWNTQGLLTSTVDGDAKLTVKYSK